MAEDGRGCSGGFRGAAVKIIWADITHTALKIGGKV